MADRRNRTALPALATKYGFRLPPPEDCLIAPNFQFHPHKPAADMDWEETNLSTGATHTTCCTAYAPYQQGHHVSVWHPICLVFCLVTSVMHGPFMTHTTLPDALHMLFTNRVIMSVYGILSA